MHPSDPWFTVVHLTALAIPPVLALVALFAPRRASQASVAALGLALLFTLATGLIREAAASTGFGIGVDAVTCVMLMLVTSLGAVVVRYSRTSLDGDRGLPRCLRWQLLTLSAVTTLIIANNLLVVVLGWTATSLALHQLLTFFGDRTPALVAAHKKFLVSRLADGFLVVCLALIHRTVGSLELDSIAAWAGSNPGLTPSIHVASVLLVIAVALKSAQIPFHGWLTQVMEAPTPVSALLHAGVVNIGGFVLIRLSPLMAHAGPAQVLLVVIGLTSAILGSLVMVTRVSVKVALAWSTCAQMGFMLVQCGLGLWHLALLHLVAHSLYKAHAFLSAGTAVDTWRVRAMAPRPPRPSPTALAVAIVASLGGAFAVLAATSTGDGSRFGVPLLALAVVPVVVRPTLRLAAQLGAVIVLSLGWHWVAALVMPVPSAAASTFPWVLACIGLWGLFVVKSMFQLFPDGWLARASYPWLFAGLFLDEWFTRATFRVWAPRLQRPERRLPPIGPRAALKGQS